jgi:hypothetical protein
LILAVLAMLGIGPSLVRQQEQKPVDDSVSTVNNRASESAPAEVKDAPEHSAASMLERFLDTNQEQIQGGMQWSHNERPSVADDKLLADFRSGYKTSF